MALNCIITERDKQNKNNNILFDIYKEKDKSSDSKCELNKLNGNSINLNTYRNNHKNKFNINEHNLHFIDDNFYRKNSKKENKDKKSCCKKIKEKIKYFEISLTGLIFMIIINFLTLIFYDIKCLFFPSKYKIFYISFYIILMFIYLFDFIFTMLIKEQKKTIYFWLDLISCITMVFDIDDISYPIIQYVLYNEDSKNNKKLNYSKQFYVEMIIKSIHILKLLRILKIYKLFSDILKEKDIRIKAKELSSSKNHIIRSLTIKKSSTNIHDQNSSNFPLNHQATTSPITKRLINMDKQKTYLDYYKQIKEIDTHKQNKMNKKIIEGISRLMIIIIILILIIGLYTDEEYSYVNNGYLCLSRQINRIKNNCKNDCINCENKCSKEIERIINNYLFHNIISNFPVIEIELNNTLYYRNKSISDSIDEKFHRKEYSYFFNEEDPYVVILASKKKFAKIECIIFLIRVIFLIFLFSFLIFFINKDVYILIFRPLDDVSKILEKVSKDPVNSKKINELIKKSNNETKEKNKFSAYLEIQNIQNTLVRISALMAIGFGEAGGEILKKNITSEEGLNPMLKGSKINAIFGFCYIHDFSEINEAFQEKTFIFINQLSDIVHSCIDKFNGIINKNLGDCYLLAWKFKEEKKDNKKDSIKNSDLINKKSELADCALLGFLNIIKKINKSRVILEYKKDPDIIKKFGNKYSIQMGFGLHTGWGIEGSIGSFYKIDCSYLSPNVNIAARLETANSIYGTDILFSGEIYELLSDFMKNICRKIDRVTVKGSKKPLDLYTVDINRNIKPGKNISKKDRLSLRERKNYYAIKKKKLWHKYNEELKVEEEPKTISELYYKQSNGLKQLLKKYKSEMFYNLFNEGFNKYIDGDWEIAFEKLKKAKYLEKNDGPTNTLYKYLSQNKLKSPPNWPGYRELTSKT